MRALRLTFPILAGLAGLTASAIAKEIPIGPHVTQNGLEVAAVYLQPIEMTRPT